MNYEIVELQISGEACTFYSVLEEGQIQTLFELFISENLKLYKDEIKEITTRLKSMAKNVGAKINFFKVHEGNYGDRVCALFDMPSQKLRLYCIRYSDNIVILGGGGPKLPGLKAYQGDENLTNAAEKMKSTSADLKELLHNKSVRFSHNSKRLEGELVIIK